MGRPKLLLPFGDSTVLVSLLDALREGGVGGALLVLAPAETSEADAALHELAQGLARDRELAQDWKLHLAINPQPERGMLSTLQAGVAALPPGFLDDPENTLLVSPADLPALSPETVRKVIEARERTGAQLVVPVMEPSKESRGGATRGAPQRKGRRRGHPLALSPARVREIAGLDPSVGLRQLLQRHADRLLEVPVSDPGTFRDVDRPEDLGELRNLRTP